MTTSLTLTNTATKKREKFTTDVSNNVTLYTCGPTVYASPHIGNWTAYIYWDTLVRVLLKNDYTVDRVMNITDVGHLTSDADEGEDKLEKGARREGKSAWNIADYYIADFYQGMKQLNLQVPEKIVRATDFINEQLDLIRTLREKGFTYEIDDGIYFDTSKFPRYADFAQLDISAQEAGARITYNTQKRNPSDFALWKFTPKGQKRDMEWETPSDISEAEEQHMGFPGWHLECSAMAMRLLGSTIDIHTGGIDHIPVHHTNEIAQSEAATGVQFSRFWLHNNHLKVNGTKISKSLENGYTLQDLHERGFSALDFRLFILQSHYSNEGNFTFDNLEAAKNRRLHWRNIAALRHQTHTTTTSSHQQRRNDNTNILLTLSKQLVDLLNNDLDTPSALRLVDEAFSQIENARAETIYRPGLVQFIETIDDLLGLQLMDTSPDISDAAKQRILERERAREKNDWKMSDKIRDELRKENIFLLDARNGTAWQYEA